MTRWHEDPEGAADQLLAEIIEDGLGLPEGSSVLAAYQYGDGGEALRRAGAHVEVWNRHMRSGRSGSPEPPSGPFDAVVLRLPKPRREQEMALHQVLAVTRPGGTIYVYGGNDEGIRSFQKTFASLVVAPETVAARGHGRVLAGRRDERPVRGRLEDWIERSVLTILGRDEPWVSYPGLFAAGALDPGTSLLLQAMASVMPRGRVLDYGCGPGAIARALSARAPSIDVTLVDNDSVALVAASQNVPGGRTMLADTPARLPAGARFDMIVSNPPLHSGVKEDHGALEALVKDARSRLGGDGELWMVVQRRVACQALLDEAFGKVVIASDDGSYRVWRAALPKAQGTVKAAGRKGRRPRAM